MNARATRAIMMVLFRLARRLEKAKQVDSALVPLWSQIELAWKTAGDLADAKARTEAEQKDKGRVLWVVFSPADGLYPRRVFTRTPNRMIRVEEPSWIHNSGRPLSNVRVVTQNDPVMGRTEELDDFDTAMAGGVYPSARDRRLARQAAAGGVS